MPPLLNDSEFALLVAATARPGTPAHRDVIAQAGTDAQRSDWARLLHLVEHHRVAALAFDGLKTIHDLIPEGARAALRKAAIRDRTDALMLINVLALVTIQLEDAGIGAICIKGPVLAEVAYGDATIRQSKDLDILIDSTDTLLALSVLVSAGFTIIEPAGLVLDRLSVWQRMRKDLTLRHNRTGVEVELHWRLTSTRLLSGSDTGHVRQRVHVGPLILNTLGSDDLLMYLCLHGAGHSWFRLKWLADINALFRNDVSIITRFYDQACVQGMKTAASAMLILLHNIYGITLPSEVALAARRSLRVRFVAWIAHDALYRTARPSAARFATTRMGLSALLLGHRLTHVWDVARYMLIDWPTVSRYSGSRRGYALAIVGRPFLWLTRKVCHKS